MGYFDSDSMEMMEVYLLETKQLLEQFNNAIMRAEDSDFFSEEDIHSIFRIMHTMKSSSAMMGLEGMSSMTHKLEDLFSHFREKYGSIKNVDKDLFELLYQVSDFIADELDGMVNEEYYPGTVEKLEKDIGNYLKHMVPADTAADEKEKADTRQDIVTGAFSGKSGVVVRVLFESGCRMENVRAFMVIRQITKLCSELESYPANLDKAQDAAAYISEHGVLIRFVSEEKDKVLDTINRGLFVVGCEVLVERTASEEPKNRNESVGSAVENEFLQVRMDRLDQLQNIASELLISSLTLDSALELNGLTEIREGEFHQVNRLINEIEKMVMAMRMVPVSRIVPRLQRVLRDICKNQDKEVEFTTSCGDIEADKSVVECVAEALQHILRNAVDHGIEEHQVREDAGKPRKGKITFTAENRGGELYITVSDDGKGIDEDSVRRRARERNLFTKPEEEYKPQEILELVMLPGFTTKDAVTEYSGRGVGLDVVKKVLEDAGGHLYISSQAGVGSTFTITVPLSLATMECARFWTGDCCFSVPARNVFRYLEYAEKQKDVCVKNGKEYILYEDTMIPLIDLRRFYGMDGKTADQAIMIYTRCGDKEGCILADSMYTQKRMVIKTIPALFGINFRANTGISGFSVMGNGIICSALDIESLISVYERKGTYGKHQ